MTIDTLNPDAATDTAATVYGSLKDRHVLITGGGTGIGEAIVEGFARQGAKVSFIDIAEEASHKLVERLTPGSRHGPTFTRCDLRNIAALEQTIASIEAANGPIEILINNAANDDRHQVGAITPEYWDNRMAVNLRHLFFASQAAARSMRKAGRGVIINFSSISWHLALPELVLYQTAKAGIEGMTRGLARELGADGIRVNAIIPGAVRTARQDLLWQSPDDVQRTLEQQCIKERVMPVDVAALVLFLCSDDARACTAHSYFVDAGWA
jgi:NAD(P)-dependent dehydrogenase (short-subunit alcohol dehydrogenase family)